jgi:hypothetical protein
MTAESFSLMHSTTHSGVCGEVLVRWVEHKVTTQQADHFFLASTPSKFEISAHRLLSKKCGWTTYLLLFSFWMTQSAPTGLGCLFFFLLMLKYLDSATHLWCGSGCTMISIQARCHVHQQ